MRDCQSQCDNYTQAYFHGSSMRYTDVKSINVTAGLKCRTQRTS